MPIGLLTLSDGVQHIPTGEPHNIVIFDIDGNIVTRTGTDVPFLKKENVFDLLGEREQEFFLAACRARGERLLLESNRGPFLVFTNHFPGTGLFVGVLFHTERETLRPFWKHRLWMNVLPSPLLVEKTPPRKSGDDAAAQSIDESYNMLLPLFIYSRCMQVAEEGVRFLDYLADKIVRMARITGCAAAVRGAKWAVLSNAWQFHMPSFIIIMFCLLSMAGQYSVADETVVEILESDGKPTVCFKTKLAYWRDKKSKAHCWRRTELDICAEIAERRGLFFDVAEKQMSDGVQLSIRFSPSFRDPAHDGLKTNLDFVDDMEGR
jgi:hypothetical protein